MSKHVFNIHLYCFKASQVSFPLFYKLLSIAMAAVPKLFSLEPMKVFSGVLLTFPDVLPT